MTDEHFPLLPSAPPPPTEADYEAIAAAVMETVRGRWFVAEFAKRNRNADSELILERIDRIEKLLHERPAVSPAERVRINLVEMAKAIAQTRSEIAAIKPDGDAKGTLSEASEELGSIVQTTERATSDILAAAEQVQEIAWTLRERGADSAICDSLDQRATDVYSACSFQDLTGQRIRKVVDVLQFLEDRIRAMIEIWGGAAQDDGPAAAAAPQVGEDRTVPHLEQQDIDRMMPSARPDAPPAESRHEAAAAAYARRADDRAHPAAAHYPGVAAGIATAAAVMTPAMAVVGATALALDPTPIATARLPELAPRPEPAPEPELARAPEPEPEPAPEPELAPEPERARAPEPEPAAEPAPAPEPEPEPQPEPTPEVDALLEAAQHPAPPPEPIHAPRPEIEADASPSEPRTDPAAVLKRILEIIRAPSEPPAGSIAAQDASATSVAAALPVDPVAAPELEAAATAAAVLILAPAAADIRAADGFGPDAVAADVVAVEDTPADAGAAQPDEPAEARAPKTVIEDAADEIPMPLPGPLTVDQAVDAMLRAQGRLDGAATHAPAGVAAPVEEADEPPAVSYEPVPPETEPAAAAAFKPPFVIEVPEFTVATRAPVPPADLAPQPPPVAEIVAAPIADPGEPEPQAPAAELHSAATAAEVAVLASAQLGEPPAVTAEPVARETEPAAAAGFESPFVIEVPEFTVATRAPDPPAELAPQPPPVAETVAAPIADPGEPEPQTPAAELHSAAAAAEVAVLASAQPDEPPVEPVADAPSRLVAAAPPAAAASEPPPAVAPPAAASAELARPAPRHPALAAIAALSDEEKIALFS